MKRRSPGASPKVAKCLAASVTTFARMESNACTDGIRRGRCGMDLLRGFRTSKHRPSVPPARTRRPCPPRGVSLQAKISVGRSGRRYANIDPLGSTICVGALDAFPMTSLSVDVPRLNAGTRTSEELSSCVGDPTQPGMATMLVPATALKRIGSQCSNEVEPTRCSMPACCAGQPTGVENRGDAPRLPDVPYSVRCLRWACSRGLWRTTVHRLATGMRCPFRPTPWTVGCCIKDVAASECRVHRGVDSSQDLRGSPIPQAASTSGSPSLLLAIHLLMPVFPYRLQTGVGLRLICVGASHSIRADSFETTRSFGRSSPPLRLSNPESPERPLGIR